MFIRCAIALSVVAMTASSASAVFFTDDPGSFFQGGAEGDVRVYLGLEDFESFVDPTLGVDETAALDDALTGGVASFDDGGNGFPNGINPDLFLSIQSNTLGDNPTTTSPRGANALAVGAPGLRGAPSAQISTNAIGDSLDLIFSQAVYAVAFNPLYFDNEAFGPDDVLGDIVTRVYDTNNNLIGTFTTEDIGYAGTSLVAVTAMEGESIGRINLSTTSNVAVTSEQIAAIVGVDIFPGVDNIYVYTLGEDDGGDGEGDGEGGDNGGPGTTIPTPSAAVAGLAGLVGLFGLGARRQRRAA